MDELHERLISDDNFVPREGQRDLLCSNRKSLRCPSLSSSPILSRETLIALKELGDVLKSIRKRMYNEGYEIVDGVVRKIC